MKHGRAQIRAAEQMLQRMCVPIYVPLQGRTIDTDAPIIQSKGARTMTLASVASSVMHPGAGRRHAERGHKEGMVLNVWALSAQQRSALFGDDAADISETGAGTGGSVGGVQILDGIEEVPVRTSSPVGEQGATDPATLIEQFHAELGGPAHEEENADYVELKARLESEEKKEFAVKVRRYCLSRVLS
jgi:hypothetical protein